MTQYGARELFDWVQQAGFVDVRVEHHMEAMRNPAMDWNTFCARVPHPWAPSLHDILQSRFSAEERQLFEAQFRPQVEAGHNASVTHLVLVSACKSD
jgi:arsenite methyltransferase